MAGGGGSTGGIGAQSPASGGFGGSMGGGEYSPNPMGGLERPQVSYDGGNMLSNMGNNTRLGNNSQLGQLGSMANAAGVPNDLSLMQGGPHVGGGFGLGSAVQQGNFNPFAPVSPDTRDFVGSVLQGPRGNYDGRNSMTAPANGFGGIEQDQDFRNFRSQHDDLSRQMNEYMQKAPMYQQLQDLQGKMQGVQSRYAPPQRSFNRAPQQQRGRYPNFNPTQQQLGGLAALLGGLGRR